MYFGVKNTSKMGFEIPKKETLGGVGQKIAKKV